MNKLIRGLIVAVVATPLFLGGAIAFAENDGTPPGYEKGGKDGWNGGIAPPGHSHGKKKGWKGGTKPPGLAKKVPVETTTTDTTTTT